MCIRDRLDAAHSAPVGRSFTGWPAGQWMLAATDGSGYTAYTRPGRYDVYDILPTDGTEEEPSPSVYEQFIAQVSGQADAAVQAAQNVPPVRPVPPGRRRPLPTLPPRAMPKKPPACPGRTARCGARPRRRA